MDSGNSADRSGLAKVFCNQKTLGLALTALALGFAPQAMARKMPDNSLVQVLQAAQQAYEADDCPGTLDLVTPIIESSGFDALAASARRPFLVMGAVCEASAGNTERATSRGRALTELPGAPAEIWNLRFAIDMQLGAYEDAVATLEGVQARDPSMLVVGRDLFDEQWMFILNQRLAKQDKDSDVRKRYLALISREDFAPARTQLGYDWMRYAHAAILARAGDAEGAKSVLARLRNAKALRDASLDTDLRALIPADFDLRAAVENEISVLKEIEREKPSLLSVTIAIADAQQMLGEGAKSLATLEAARPYGILEKQFSDRDDQINWWWDSLAQAYTMLGRYDDAQAAYRQAIAEGEDGVTGRNVSQVLNVTFIQRKFGDNKAVLETLETIDIEADDYASPYGKMPYHLAHGCASWALDHKAAAAKDIAWAEAHEDVSSSSLTQLYLCTGNEDAAAALLIRRLDDSDDRTKALVDLSYYQPTPETMPVDPEDAVLARVRDRDDVQAAIERAGGLRHFNIPSL